MGNAAVASTAISRSLLISGGALACRPDATVRGVAVCAFQALALVCIEGEPWRALAGVARTAIRLASGWARSTFILVCVLRCITAELLTLVVHHLVSISADALKNVSARRR